MKKKQIALKDWYTAQELAGLPGMPETDRSVRRLDLPYCKKPKGKGREYAFSGLPAATQAYLKAAAMVDQIAPETLAAVVRAPAPTTAKAVEVGMLMGTVLDDPKRLEEKGRVAYQRWEALQPLLMLPQQSHGRKALAQGIAQRLGMSVAQVYRLESKARDGGLQGLMQEMRRDKGTARVCISGEFERLLHSFGRADEIAALADDMAQLCKNAWAAGAPSSRQCWLQVVAQTAAQCIGRGWSQSQARALTLLDPENARRWVNSYKEFRLLAIVKRDAKRAYADYHPAVQRTWDHLKPGELVFGDVSPIDIPVKRADGSTAYMRMIAWLDAATAWMFVTMHLCDKGKGVRREHVAASFASMCDAAPFGMPVKLYLDNGSEYKWNDMIGAWQQLARLTGNRIHTDLGEMSDERGRLIRSIPFRPRGKIIESRFATMHTWMGWHPSWQGGNRLAKKAAMLGQLPEAVDYHDSLRFIAGVMADYHATPQGQGTHLDGKSPAQAIELALDGGWKPMRVDKDALMLAFADVDRRMVKGGKVQFAGQTWYDDRLVGLDGYVRVRYPRMEGYRGVAYIFDDQHADRLICCALPESVFQGDAQDGAKEAARRGQVLRQVAGKMAGNVTAFEHQPGLLGHIHGVDAIAAKAQAAAQPITLSAEAQRLLAERNRAEAHVSDQTHLQHWHSSILPIDIGQKTKSHPARLCGGVQRNTALEPSQWPNMAGTRGASPKRTCHVHGPKEPRFG